MEMNNHRPEEVTEMETEVIKNVKARNLKPGDRLHNCHGPVEVVLEARFHDDKSGPKQAGGVTVWTAKEGMKNAARRRPGRVLRDSYPADHMVATIIEEG